MVNINSYFENTNAEVVDRIKSNAGFQITYEPQRESNPTIRMGSTYIKADKLEQISNALAEFTHIINNYPEDVSFVVGYIIPSDTKPIKIQRINTN